MLRNLEKLGKEFQSRFRAVDVWPEIKLSDSDKAKLANISNFNVIHDSSIQLNVSADKHCVIPSQYLLYAVYIKEFALALKSYTDIVGSLKNKFGSQITWDILNSKSLTDNPLSNLGTGNPLSNLDGYSKTLFLKPFEKDNCVLGAKNILNGDVTNKKLRGEEDFFGSVVLSVINIPNVSSDQVGGLVYELASNIELYEYLERRFIGRVPLICSSTVIGEFVRSVLSFLYQYDRLERFLPLVRPNRDENYSSLEADDTKLTSIFYTSVDPASVNDLSMGGTKRFYEEPLFIEGGKYCYLSTQWTNVEEASRLNLNVFKKVIESLYSEFSIDIGDVYTFRSSSTASLSNSFSGGMNVIYYGAPGTGKSYAVDNAINEVKAIRTVFHADSQFSDFVGCLKPTSTENGNAGYEFRPGPFTLALVAALNDPQNSHWLVIEEINRAAAAAVFGEIFQLLDRDETGKSKYLLSPSDPDMIAYIQSKLTTSLEGNKIYIPENLSILATMNSSDQAVMPLDTAFKRRWKFKYVPLDFETCAQGNISVLMPTRGKVSIPWSMFAKVVNNILSILEIPEDRHFGPFFLNNAELKDESSQKEALTGKLFMYLWDDLLRHGLRTEIFSSEINTYGQLITTYNREQLVFSERFYSELDVALADLNFAPTEDQQGL